MSQARAWTLLGSGRRRDLLNPQPNSWTDRDLAIGLSRTYRWGGHSKWDLPLSVAQHSLLVLALRQKFSAVPLSQAEARRELLHDAREGLIGFDPITPLKPHLGEGFREVDARLGRAIDARYSVPSWSALDHLLHKQADHLAAACEARHVAGWPRHDMINNLGITIDPLDDDPLARIAGCEAWEPWAPRMAAAIFLAKLTQLSDTDRADENPACVAGAIRREADIARLAADFAHLPSGRTYGLTERPVGSSLDDTYVTAIAGDGSEHDEGLVVGGERFEDGSWNFETPFTLFTDYGLVVCQGFNCDVR